MNTQILEGEVVQVLWASGSKQAHQAVCLQTASQRWKLRRVGGHAFTDPALTALVGQSIRATGHMLAGSVFLMQSWEPTVTAG